MADAKYPARERPEAPGDRDLKAFAREDGAGIIRPQAGDSSTDNRSRSMADKGDKMRVPSRWLLLLALLSVSSGAPVPAGAAPEGQMTWAVHASLAPAWFDPAETTGISTPFMIIYALHDGLMKPMPGHAMAPSLAESWTVSKDGLTYDFVLRKGVKFHNGDPLGAEDVKFSFERYKGVASATFKAHVAAVDVLDVHRVRVRLKKPWADFMTFYATPATGAAWIVPKNYVERVGDDGFKKTPVGAGPYRFVSFNPGIELVLEAYEGYWRKTPSVKRLVFKSVPTSPRAWRCSSAARRTSFDAGEIVSDMVYVPKRLRPPRGGSGLGLIAGYLYSAPYEDLKLRAK